MFMKKLTTSKDMLAEMRIAQQGEQPGWVHPDHIPSPPGSNPADKGEKPSPKAAAELQSDIEYGYAPYELEDQMGVTDCPEGCFVEADGVCEHGWLSAGRTLGLM